MEDIKIILKTGPREEPFERFVKSGITIEQLVKDYPELPYTILAAKIDNKIGELTKKIDAPCNIEFLDMRYQGAATIYQRSVSLIYLKAINDVIGKASVNIENSLSQGLYTEIRAKEPVTDEMVKEIEKGWNRCKRFFLI